MRLIEELIGSKPKVQLLQKIIDSKHAYSVRDLARLSGLPKSTVAVVVSEWERIGFLKTRKVGQTKTAIIKPGFPLVFEIKKMFQKSREHADKIIETIRRDSFLKSKDVVCVIIFGSLARRNLGGASDADVLIVTKRELGEYHKAQKAWENLYAKLWVLPAPLFLTEQQVKSRIKEKDSFIKNVFRQGIPLKGEKWFDLAKRTL